MPIAYRVANVGVAAGVTAVEAADGSAVVREDVRPLVPAAKVGQLTTRTDADTGTLTMDSGHGITTGAKLDVFWSTGSRRNLTVGTVATNSVPIDGGSGDDLPDNLTAITAMVPVEKPFTVNGDDAEFLAVKSEAAGYVVFVDSLDIDIETAVFRVTPASGKVWDAATGGTSPIAGVSTSLVKFSHGSTVAREMIAVAMGPGTAAIPVPFLPSDYSNLVLWGEPGTNGSEFFQERTGVSATTPATVATDPVGTFKFATGQYWTAPTDNTTRPLLALDGNGRLYPTADGVNDCLRGGDLSALFPSAGTLVYRFKITNDASAQLVVLVHEDPIAGGADSWDRWGGTISNPGPLRSVRLETQPIIPRASWVTVVVRSSASGWTRRVNGVEDINTTAAFQAGTNWIMFCGFGPGDATPGKFMAGPIACVIAYSDVKSDLECEQLEAYAETVAPP